MMATEPKTEQIGVLFLNLGIPFCWHKCEASETTPPFLDNLQHVRLMFVVS